MKSVLFFIFFISLFFACRKDPECNQDAFLAIPPYSEPVWSPDGNMLGFNHVPLTSVSATQVPGCGTTFTYTYASDSDGFWLAEKDGSGLRRAVTFELHQPAWSPDGKWICFCIDQSICKIAFDGINFDTAHIINLTSNTSGHFFPSWAPGGDTIYYDSDESNTQKPYQIYKMASDGSGKTIIGNKGEDSIFSREPYCTPNQQILNVRGDQVSTYVFTMHSNGSNVRQLTTLISSHEYIHMPRSFQNKIFYEDYGIWSFDTTMLKVNQIIQNSTQGYSISKHGTIAYVNFGNTDKSVLDRQQGCIWLSNIDGTNQRPFILNNY
jgi:hypothetical protein